MAQLLLVEDDELLRDGLQAQLQQAGHRITLAEDGQIALDHLATSLQIDPKYRELAEEESDFDSIRQHPGFRELTSVVV